MSWRAERLTYRYPGAARDAISGVSLRLAAGETTAVLGPNGSGKSTLLRLLLGTLRPASGEAWLADRPLADWPRADLARRVGVVPQGEEAQFPLSVRQLVGMGRYPHLGPWRREGEADRLAIEAAMRRCDVADLSERHIETLSGGERQRARIARALAQEAPALALDEPTAALDIAHEMAIFELLRDLGRAGKTILLSTHNINLAARYADRVAVLRGGGIAAFGTPADVLSEDLVQSVYGWPVRIVSHPGPGPDAGAPQVLPLAGEACHRMEER